MKQRGIVASIAALTLFAFALAPALSAQDSQMFQVLASHVDVGQAQHYEAAIPGMWAAAKKAGFTTPITVSQSMSEPGTYIFVAPVASWADLGEIHSKWNQAVASSTSAFTAITAASNSNDTAIYRTRPDLSYQPESPRLSPDERTFGRVIWLYPYPEHTLALETMLKGANALNAQHGNPNPVGVFEMIAGADGPVYGIQVRGKSQADFYAESERIEGKRDDEWASLMRKMTPLVRKIEYGSSVRRPDLSYQP